MLARHKNVWCTSMDQTVCNLTEHNTCLELTTIIFGVIDILSTMTAT